MNPKKEIKNLLFIKCYPSKVVRLNASIVDIKITRECLAKGKNMLKPVAVVALGGEEVIVQQITP